MKHASDTPAGAFFSGRSDFPRVRSAEQLPWESIHETVVVDPDVPVRCFSYEDAGVLIPAHWHHSLEILLIEAGGMTVTLNEARVQLRPQDFILINSTDLHSTNCPEHSRVCVLQIPYPFLKQNIPEYDRIRFRPGPCGVPETDAAFRLLLRSLQRCRDADGISEPSISSSARSLHFKSLLYELLSLCVSSYLLPEAEREQSLSDTERARLIAVTDYVHAHYSEPVSLRGAAAAVALNPEYFCRFFKKNMGITFLEYVSQVRFSHVCQDILHTDQSVTEILSRHGFTNYKLFRRMFRETYGCTPSAKRRALSARQAPSDHPASSGHPVPSDHPAPSGHRAQSAHQTLSGHRSD